MMQLHSSTNMIIGITLLFHLYDNNYIKNVVPIILAEEPTICAMHEHFAKWNVNCCEVFYVKGKCIM
jgi:hypothetical protein